MIAQWRARVAELRAALDENGLPGVEVEHTPTGISVHTDGWVHSVVRADGTLITPTDEGDIDDVIAALHGQMYDDANTGLRALGLPSAAEVRALVAEVERLRAVIANADAWRAESEANEAYLRAQRDLLRDALAACVRAMGTWGAQGDGVPEGGPIGAAFDAAERALDEVPRG